MKMMDVIEKISELYRLEQNSILSMRQEKQCVEFLLMEAEEKHYENITAAEYKRLTLKKTILDNEIKNKKTYCQGIFDTRELLMDMVFSFDKKLTTQN